MKNQKNKQQNSNGVPALFHRWYRQALNHSKYRWVVILGTLLYLVSPIDISPDVFPVLGWIDDGLVASLLVTEVSSLMTEALKRRRSDSSPEYGATPTEIETVVEADNIKTINVEAVTIS